MRRKTRKGGIELTDHATWPADMPEGSIWEWTAPSAAPSSMILRVQSGQLVDVADGFIFPTTPRKDVPGKDIALFRPDLGERIWRRVDLEHPMLASLAQLGFQAMPGAKNRLRCELDRASWTVYLCEDGTCDVTWRDAAGMSTTWLARSKLPAQLEADQNH